MYYIHTRLDELLGTVHSCAHPKKSPEKEMCVYGLGKVIYCRSFPLQILSFLPSFLQTTSALLGAVLRNQIRTYFIPPLSANLLIGVSSHAASALPPSSEP